MTETKNKKLWNQTASILVFAAGLALLAFALIPMAMALSVSNILLDNGQVDPQSMATIDAWDRWAFSLPFLLSLAVGGLILVFQFVSSKSKSRYALAAISLMALTGFVGLCIPGLFLVR